MLARCHAGDGKKSEELRAVSYGAFSLLLVMASLLMHTTGYISLPVPGGWSKAPGNFGTLFYQLRSCHLMNGRETSDLTWSRGNRDTDRFNLFRGVPASPCDISRHFDPSEAAKVLSFTLVG